MIPEIKNRKRKRITFFQFHETLNCVDFSFFWLINKLEQQLDFAIPAHFTSRRHAKRYLLHLLVFLLIYSKNVREQKLAWRIPQRLKIYWKTMRVSL